MTKFVPKEVLGDSTFVAVYDPESGDTGYVRLGDLVRESETTVTTTTSPGGGLELRIFSHSRKRSTTRSPPRRPHFT